MSWITPYRLSPEDRPHTRTLHMALVRDLYEHGRVPGLILLGSLGIFFGILKDATASSGWLRILFPCLAVLMIFRSWLAFQGKRLDSRHHRIFRAFMWFFAGTLATGLLLGGLILASFRVLDPAHFMLLCLCEIGVASVAVVSMAASPLCYAALVVPSVGSLLVEGVFYAPFGLGFLFPVAVAVALATLLYMSGNVHTSLCRNVLLGQRLSELALRDSLTGLRNRRYLHEFMQEETPRVLRRWMDTSVDIRDKQCISLVLVDLDFFKHVNDTHGHAAGDAVLVQAAQLLRDVVRKPDMVLRWGGEEFLILALDSDRTVPPLIAVRALERMAHHTFILPGGQTYQQTCSVGFALFPFHTQRPESVAWEQVFRMADESLYIAKGKGRNRIHGILAGEGDPDAVVEAMNQPAPDFEAAAKAGLIEVI